MLLKRFLFRTALVAASAERTLLVTLVPGDEPSAAHRKRIPLQCSARSGTSTRTPASATGRLARVDAGKTWNRVDRALTALRRAISTRKPSFVCLDYSLQRSFRRQMLNLYFRRTHICRFRQSRIYLSGQGYILNPHRNREFISLSFGYIACAAFCI